MISVIITTFNRPAGLRLAISSVLMQTYRNYELIVVDDGSNINIHKLIYQYFSCCNIKYIRNVNNLGLAASRNIGIKNSKGSFIAFLDDDDNWVPEKLMKQMDVFGKNNISKLGVVYTGNFITDRRGSVMGTNCPSHRGEIFDQVRKNQVKTVSSSFLFSREALVDVGGFDEELKSYIDHDIWFALGSKGYFCDVVNEPLVNTKIRYNNESMMTRIDERVIGLEKFVKKWEEAYTHLCPKDNWKKIFQYYFSYNVIRITLDNLFFLTKNNRKVIMSAIRKNRVNSIIYIKLILKSIVPSVLRHIFRKQPSILYKLKTLI